MLYWTYCFIQFNTILTSLEIIEDVIFYGTSREYPTGISLSKYIFLIFLGRENRHLLAHCGRSRSDHPMKRKPFALQFSFSCTALDEVREVCGAQLLSARALHTPGCFLSGLVNVFALLNLQLPRTPFQKIYLLNLLPLSRRSLRKGSHSMVGRLTDASTLPPPPTSF